MLEIAIGIGAVCLIIITVYLAGFLAALRRFLSTTDEVVKGELKETLHELKSTSENINSIVSKVNDNIGKVENIITEGEEILKEARNVLINPWIRIAGIAAGVSEILNAFLEKKEKKKSSDNSSKGKNVRKKK